MSPPAWRVALRCFALRCVDWLQRFYTDRLHKELHWFYFYILTETIGVKAEIVSCERRTCELQELLQGTIMQVGVRACSAKPRPCISALR